MRWVEEAEGLRTAVSPEVAQLMGRRAGETAPSVMLAMQAWRSESEPQNPPKAIQHGAWRHGSVALQGGQKTQAHRDSSTRC